MTQAEAKRLCKVQGCTFRKTDWGDYRIALKGNPQSAYYTNDLEDAVDTAKAMRYRADELGANK